jgi:hypothetical protein
MTNASGQGRSGQTAPASVLAGRIAAALVHHEPGWRLPRLTALARRYSVSVAEVDAAVDELTARRLLRRLPDGQVFRASPAEYLVPMAGLAGLASAIDPMGGTLTRRSRLVPCRRVPDGTARALRIAPGETVLVIESLWRLGGEPGALSATYFPERLASMAGDLTGLLPGRPGLAGEPQAGRSGEDGGADGWPDGAWEDTGWEDSGGWREAAWLSRGNAGDGRPARRGPARAGAARSFCRPHPAPGRPAAGDHADGAVRGPPNRRPGGSQQSGTPP